MKALREIRCRRKPSERLTKKITETYDYFLEKVDPIIGACITHLLSEQPLDIPKAMIDYLQLKSLDANKEFRQISNERTRKEIKLFLATSVGPVIAKLVNRIALDKPDDVMRFMIKELETMLINDDSAPVVPAIARTVSSGVSRDPVSVRIPEVVEEKSIQLAVLGLGGSGKSSLLNMLQGKFDTRTRPTIGFRPVSMMLSEDTKVRFYDLGGGKKIRDIWKQYYHDVHGIIYVIDGTTKREDLQECIKLFTSTINGEFLARKPLLVFSNKQDLEGSIPAVEWQAMLQSSILRPDQALFSDSSAYVPTEVLNGNSDNFKIDNRIESSLEWLLNKVIERYDELNERVETDSLKKSEEEAQKRISKEKKILKNKIACAFMDSCDPEYIEANHIESEPENIFTEEDGLIYLASEVGEDVAGLPIVAIQIASMVGYQKLALTIIGGLKAPVSKKKAPMDWHAIHALIVELRGELHLQCGYI